MRSLISILLLVCGLTSFAQVLKIPTVGEDMLDFPSDFINKTGIPVGENFPEYSLEDINGNTISSKDLDGKLVVYNFWFVGCYGCHKEEPFLAEIAADLADREDVVFISFCNSASWRTKRYIEKNGDFEYALIPAKNGKICEELFKVQTFPTNMLVKDGQILQNVSFPMLNEIVSDWYREEIKERL
jgi:peroxiredoxin